MTKTEQNRASITESLDPHSGLERLTPGRGTSSMWSLDWTGQRGSGGHIRQMLCLHRCEIDPLRKHDSFGWQFSGKKKPGDSVQLTGAKVFLVRFGQCRANSTRQYQYRDFRSLQVTSYHLSRKGHEGHDWTKALMDFCPPSSHSCCVSDSSSKIIGCQPVGCRPGPMFFSIENRSNATPANSCLDLWWPGTPQAPRTLRRQWWMSRKGPGNELEVGLQAPRTATAIDIQWFS